MSSERILDAIKEKIFEIVPKDTEITNIEFEGSEVAIYSKNPGVVIGDENNNLVAQIARTIRKRVVIRSDPSVRLNQDTVKETIRNILADKVEIGDIDFDDALGEVLINVDKPDRIMGKNSNILNDIVIKTLWRPNIYRTPPIQSDVIRSVRNVLSTDTEQRRDALLKIGKIVHREALLEDPIIRITALGGYKEVGRSSTLLQTGDANVLIDCGVSVGQTTASQMLPRFDLPEFSITDLDSVVISHAHLDHCLPGNTLVQMADGSQKHLSKIKKGEKVISFNWNKSKYESAIVAGKTKTDGHDFKYRIYTPYTNIEASYNHRFFYVKNLEVQEIYVEDLNENILIPTNPNHLDLKSISDKYKLQTDIKFYGKIKLKKTLKLNKKLKDEYPTNYYLRDLIPITANNFREILRKIGYLRKAKKKSRIEELPYALLDLYRRKEGYITRSIAEKMIEFLNSHKNKLESIIGTDTLDIFQMRNAVSLTRNDLGSEMGLSQMQIQYREEGYEDQISNEMRFYLIPIIEGIIFEISQIIYKIEKILSYDVNWQKITRIEKIKNKECLYDIEVKPNSNFVANGIIVHNCGFVPFLYKYGYEGPVYTTPPTRDLMTMLQIDYLDIAEKEGKLLPYSKMDIRKTMLHTITINYGEVTDIAPGVKLTFHNAGHILGSSLVHLHIGEGKYNIAFAHDFKFSNSRLLDKAKYQFPRLETIVMESTYGNPQDINPSRQQCEQELADIIIRTLDRGGKVLIPVLAVGRAQELQLIIENLMRNERIPQVPVYLDGMIKEATAITTSHPEFVSRQLRERIFVADDSPFLSSSFNTVTDMDTREEIINGGPCIIMATSGMLVGGPSVHYFKGLAEDEKNAIIFVSYQARGSLGRKLDEGAKEVQMKDDNNKTYAIEVKLEVSRISGFTGHSDRRELMEFAKRLSPRPKQYLLVHGEASKCITLANSIARTVKREAQAPEIGATFRLY